MPAVHELGYISGKRDFFYYCAEKDQWFRLLVRGGYEQGYLKEISIALTPPSGFIEVGDIVEMGKEYIYITDPFKPKPGDRHTQVLPRAIYDEIVKNMGEEFAARLLDHNYIAVIDLHALIECEEGGYLSEMLDANPKYDRVKARLVEVPGYYQRPTGFTDYE